MVGAKGSSVDCVVCSCSGVPAFAGYVAVVAGFLHSNLREIMDCKRHRRLLAV